MDKLWTLCSANSEQIRDACNHVLLNCVPIQNIRIHKVMCSWKRNVKLTNNKLMACHNEMLALMTIFIYTDMHSSTVTLSKVIGKLDTLANHGISQYYTAKIKSFQI